MAKEKRTKHLSNDYGQQKQDQKQSTSNYVEIKDQQAADDPSNQFLDDRQHQD